MKEGNPFVIWKAILVATLSTFPADLTLAPGSAVGQSNKRPSEATRLKYGEAPGNHWDEIEPSEFKLLSQERLPLQIPQRPQNPILQLT